ncbi:MAG: hypothetical protein KY461_04965 [Actinobacteria bacterium]|nr:hypothetical protein [Actinomycetota bacterium]
MVDDTATTPHGTTDGPTQPAPRDDASADDGGRRRRRWWILPWLVATVAVLVAMASTSQWLTLRAQEQTRHEVQRAAEEFVVALMNWDATDGLEDTREELRERGTGQFLTEIDETFGGDGGTEAEEFGYVSVGDVQDVFIQRIQEDEAVALGVVIQTITAESIEVAERTARSARITLVREDDEWLVSAVDVFVIDEAEGAAVPDDEDAP